MAEQNEREKVASGLPPDQWCQMQFQVGIIYLQKRKIGAKTKNVDGCGWLGLRDGAKNSRNMLLVSIPDQVSCS